MQRSASYYQTQQLSLNDDNDRSSIQSLETTRLDRKRIKDLEQALWHAGYDVGKVDGLIDQSTEVAISEFQLHNSLPITGRFDEKTARMLSKRLNQTDREASQTLLQEGHAKKRDERLGEAIALYQRAAELDPSNSAAHSSLSNSLRIRALRQWAESRLPLQCRDPSRENDEAILAYCVNNFFAFTGQPINPRIVQGLSSWLSDSGDQVTSINLKGSQDSNQFCCAEDIEIIKEEAEELRLQFGEEYQHLVPPVENIDQLKELLTPKGVYIGELDSTEEAIGLLFECT